MFGFDAFRTTGRWRLLGAIALAAAMLGVAAPARAGNDVVYVNVRSDRARSRNCEVIRDV